MKPSLLARIVYHVGRPAMFDGKRFLPETGMPIWKIVRSRTVFADCEPEPLTVATWMLKSLTTGVRCAPSGGAATSVVAMKFLCLKAPLRDNPIICPESGR